MPRKQIFMCICNKHTCHRLGCFGCRKLPSSLFFFVSNTLPILCFLEKKTRPKIAAAFFYATHAILCVSLVRPLTAGLSSLGQAGLHCCCHRLLAFDASPFIALHCVTLIPGLSCRWVSSEIITGRLSH